VLYSMFKSCGLDCYNYSSTLIGWCANVTTPNSLLLEGINGMKYGLNAIAARDSLINVKGWSITGDTLVNQNCNPFPIGISTDEKDAAVNLTIFPNPTKDRLYVSIDNINYANPSKIEIYNTLGQLLLTQEVNQNSRIELDINHLSRGMYYLSYEQSVTKVIVE
jgi:hypothetical protein